MYCFEGITDSREWFSDKPMSQFKGAPFWLSGVITKYSFEVISNLFCFINAEQPGFLDKSHDQRWMQCFWNKHMTQEHSLGWLSVDEMMEDCMNKYYPEFMAVPHKPHPLGNEYCFIANGGKSKLAMQRVKLLEGKDWPMQLGKYKWAKIGDTVGCCKWQNKSTTQDGWLQWTVGSVLSREFWNWIEMGFGDRLWWKCGRYHVKGVMKNQIDAHSVFKHWGILKLWNIWLMGNNF